MPYKSDAQRRYFNANRAQLEAQGVDVDEWNDSSRGMKLPERAKKKKTEKSAKEAVVIKGNPKFVEGNKDADKFYEVLRRYLEQKGYGVSYDAGEPHTVPKPADLWLGHSRGVDRLRFAPEHTKTLALGAPNGINHPKDKAMKPGDVPGSFHYRLTKAMQKQLDAELESTEKSAIAMLAKLAADSEYSERPSIGNLLTANVGTLGTQLGMASGVKQYVNHVVGKPDTSYFKGLTPRQLMDLRRGLPLNNELQGKPITDSWFDKATHKRPGFTFALDGTLSDRLEKPYSDQRLKQYRKIMKLFGKDAPNVSPYSTGTHAAYVPSLNTVWANPGIKDDAGHILAHELGHARQRKLLLDRWFKTLRGAGAAATAYGGLAPFLRSDPDNARNDALIGTAGMLPTLGVEFDASLRGSNLMKRLAQQEGTWSKMKLLDKLKYRLGAFKGFPSYLAAAALPLASYGTMRGLGGYNRKPQQTADTSGFGKQIQQLVNKVREQLK